MAYRVGTNGNDTLTGTDNDDFFWGNDGSDSMFGGHGNDTFFAGEGEDYMFGGTGSDTVNYSGISEQPSFFGLTGVYVDLPSGFGAEVGAQYADYYSSIENVTGSYYNDWILGDGNANVIRGLAGDDFIDGGNGGDTLDGGDGVDGLLYSNSTARVVVDLLNNTASGGYATGDVISGFESLAGSAYNDILSGTNGANIIEGGDGSDTINARSGNDTVRGDAGNDTIDGGGGSDRLSGGTGNDRLTGGSGSDTFVFVAGDAAGTDHVTDFNVDQDTLEIDASGFGISMVNYNPYTFFCDVVVSFSGGGSVVLDHIFLSDVSEVSGQINLV